jgi:hypothetical protein
MRTRDLFTIDALNATPDALALLPTAIALLVIIGTQVAFGAALGLMVVRPHRLFDGLLLLSMVILLWLCLTAVGKEVESAKGKLVNAHNLLIDVASHKCRCDPNAIIIEAPAEPELIGKPSPKGYCDACQARALLQRQYPEAFEPSERRDSGFAHAFHSFVRIGTPEEFEAHQSKSQ